ncbi:unnamed protein product [Rotaria magnacalcarata]|uniref:DZF domain-containing protein n=1 Tax=Rotaria magnacalcarata TaxID=392030 RepID=A0A816VHA1_9BILA|nr:unnamed protein product [Rotaria magnacalcarata]
MLKGAMKVSILSMRHSLRIDHEYTLVLLCANKPTITLLNDICQELANALNKQVTSANQSHSMEELSSIQSIYQVHTNVVDACLNVQSNRLPEHTIRIMLTSPVFCSEKFSNRDQTTDLRLAELNSDDPTDMLDKNICLQAATEISHSNWFTRFILHHNNTLVVLGRLRNLQYKQTPLSCLNLGCLI